MMEKPKRKGSTKHCAFGMCNSDSRYADRPAMENVFFIRFPQLKKNFERCHKWSKACSRENFDEKRVTKDTYICSLHFVGENGPTDTHPDPFPANATKYDVLRLSKTPRRKIKRNSVLCETSPNIAGKRKHSEMETSEVAEIETSEVAEILLSLSNQEEKENSQISPAEKREEEERITTTVMVNKHASTQTQSVTSSEISLRIQNRLIENENKNLKSEIELMKCAKEPSKYFSKSELVLNKPKKPQFGVEDIENSDSKCKFYTGLTYLQFMQLYKFLEPAVSHLKYWNRKTEVEFFLPPQSALLMVLMRLRQGYSHQDLSYRFGTSASTVSKIILTWIQFVYQQFLPLKELMFPETVHIKEYLPLSFKKYKNIRCIIDCTEFFSQRPGNFHKQGNMFSSYKSHTTYKVLVAIAPNGSIVFCSDVFEGSISDRDIVVQSRFIDHLNPGDTVMADRGFNIKDLLNERKVDLIIPPFLAGRPQLTAQEEALTKDIAKHRIHVERAIERIKKIKLLQRTIPLSLEPVLTQTVFVVCCLVNFQEPIVK